VFANLTEDEVVAQQQEIFAREAQLEAEQEALDAVIRESGNDAHALIDRAYCEEPKAA
jgi:hypothetical protein